MGVIQDFIDEDREFREQLRKIRRDEIKQLEDIVSSRFDKEAHSRRETEKQMISFIDERCSLLQNEIFVQTKDRTECCGELESELEADFPKLQDCNQAESHER